MPGRTGSGATPQRSGCSRISRQWPSQRSYPPRTAPPSAPFPCSSNGKKCGCRSPAPAFLRPDQSETGQKSRARPLPFLRFWRTRHRNSAPGHRKQAADLPPGKTSPLPVRSWRTDIPPSPTWHGCRISETAPAARESPFCRPEHDPDTSPAGTRPAFPKTAQNPAIRSAFRPFAFPSFKAAFSYTIYFFKIGMRFNIAEIMNEPIKVIANIRSAAISGWNVSVFSPNFSFSASIINA